MPDLGFTMGWSSGLSEVDALEPEPSSTVETGSRLDKVASLDVTEWRE